MSVTIANSPTQASQTAQGRTASNNALLSALNTREWHDSLHIRYPEFALVTLLGYLGFEDSTTQNEFSHFELDRTREIATIAQATSDVSISTITATVTTSDTTQFIIPYDIVRLPSGRLAHVDSVSVSGTVSFVVRSLDAAVNFTAADFDPTSGDGVEYISQMYNLAGECFTAPAARTHAPERVFNYLNKIPKTTSICDDEYTNTKEIMLGGKPYWYWMQQDIDMKEHKKDVEMSVLLGETASLTAAANSTLSTATGGYGIIPRVFDVGLRGTFPSGGFVEQDMIDFLTELAVYSASNEWLGLVGDQLMRDITTACRDYHVAGGVDYGTFAGLNEVGMKVGSYVFNDKVVSFVEYKPFSDGKLFPQQNADINYRNFMLAANLGTDGSGDPYVELMYKKSQNGQLYKMFKTYNPGNILADVVVQNNYVVSNNVACLEEYITTWVGVRMRGANNHGMLYAA